jgi:hypothetical protein
MALEIAEYVAKTVTAKLVFVGRSEFPSREDWPEWLETHDANDNTSRKIAILKRIAERGSEVLVLTGDVADRMQMKGVIEQAESRFGAINGVIHCAGTPGGGLIQLKEHDAAAAVLRPKVHGTLLLSQLLSGKKLDFLVLCSSLSALIGGVGHVDYCAANAFMDAFAQARRDETAFPIVAINWNAWQGVGMAASLDLPQAFRGWQQEIHSKGITAVEGTEALIRILGAGLPQVAVSTQDLTTLIEEHYNYTPPAEEVAPGPQMPASHKRPNLGVAYVAPRNDLERQISELWQRFLGIADIGIHDNFFVLGGHSLLGTRLISRLRDTFKIDVPLRRLFEAPTIAGLADTVAKRLFAREEEETQRLLEQLKSLDEHEVEQELAKRSVDINGRNGQHEKSRTASPTL